MELNHNTLTSLELFAGAGGLGIGLEKAGFKPAAVVEWDRYCCDTIRENRRLGQMHVADWPDVYEGDVRNFDYGLVEKDIDIVSGGPPCQPFSMGGKHRAFDDERDMFNEAVRAVRELRPKAFIFENVKGLTRKSFKNYFEYVNLQLHYPFLCRRPDEDWADHLRRLEQHHTSGSVGGHPEYRVVTNLLNAADYGVPQRRERVFFVGFRSDLNVAWSFPEPTHSHESLLWAQAKSTEYWERHKVPTKDRVLSDRAWHQSKRLGHKPNMKAWKTVRDALGDLPDPAKEPLRSKKYFNHVFHSGARQYVGHTGSPLDEPSKTLKAGVHGVPGGENMLRRPDGSIRYFSVRESARLQTFPDDFIFHGSWSEAMRQLGNAVPVRLAQIVGDSVSECL